MKLIQTLRYRKPTSQSELEIVRFWKKYAMRLWNEMTVNVTLDNLKLEDATFTEEEVKELERLIEKVNQELNIKFVKQTEGKKFKKPSQKNGDYSQNYSIQTVDYTKIKENKKIYNTFTKMQDEHIRYFKEFPKYVKGRTQAHLNQIIDFLEESKETITFDAKKLANCLELTQGMSRRHGNFIARDQLGKFTASINQAQAEFIGVKRYIWRTMEDERVRHKHREREGKIYSYDNPPEGGNPGIDYRCRCYAEDIIHLEA